MSEQIKLRAREELYEIDPNTAHLLGIMVNERYSEVETGKKTLEELTKDAYEMLPLVQSMQPKPRRNRQISLTIEPGVKRVDFKGERQKSPSPLKVMEATRAIDPATGKSDSGWTIDRSAR